MRQFTSRQPDGGGRPAVPAKLEFRLDGEPFLVELRMDGDAVLEWSELAAVASDDELSSQAGVAFTSRFFRLMMPPEVYTAFRAHMRKYRTPPETLMEIMQVVNEEMERLVQQEASRPTGQSSRSSPGGAAKDERTLKIISLAAEGDVEWVDSPDRPQPARNQQRRDGRRPGQQGRRRAG